jgi:hypothetical protein
MRMIPALIAAFVVAALSGCTEETAPSKNTQNTGANLSGSEKRTGGPGEPMLASAAFQILGTVTFKDLEGGFYAIESFDGKKYDPINLPESFRKDGLKVRVTARPQRDVMSFRMYGEIIEVIRIEAQ